MVRQLGIEQQVILQPAAPVAMRNKAVLCRPLSMCRKTQASVVQCETTGSDNSAASVQTEEFEDLSTRHFQRKKEPKTQSITVQTEVVDLASPSKTRDSDVQTAELPATSLNDSASQTDLEEPENIPNKKEECPPEKPLFIPIPIPVPIYIPTPVYLYARPVPFLLPFPLPCLLPLPVPDYTAPDTTLVPDDADVTVDDVIEQEPDAFDEVLVKTPESDASEDDIIPSSIELNTESLRIVTESVLSEPAVETLSNEKRGLKRLAPSSDSDSEGNDRDEGGVPEETEASNTPGNRSPVTSEPEQPITSAKPNTPPPEQTTPPAPKRPRHTMVVSDANYHLKFSYGINAWRHWVQQKLSNLGGPAVAHQRYPYLKTELLSMSESDLNLALSQFVREVRKPNNECYVADSIFYLCLGIQEYLNENGCTINLFGGPVFTDFSQSLDNILANFQPRISPEGLLICRIEEEHLWEAQQLGTETPEVLLFTMLYLNTKHFGLRLGTVHRQLAFSHIHFIDSAVLCNFPSSIFESGTDSSTTLRLDMNEDYPERCPVHLFKSYVERCPSHLRSADDMFYMVPNYPVTEDDDWFSSTPMKSTELQVILNRIKMVKEIQEAFMNGQPDGGF